jgi:uncharacterized membrane protein YdbT with pleckstrin-like domain
VPYPTKLLNDNETVVLDLRPHWWFLVPRGVLLAIVLVAGIAALGWADWAGAIMGVIVVAALIFFLLRLAVWSTTNFVVTSDRIIFRHGVLAKRGVEIPLDRINTVVFNQGPFERIIGAGDLEIESAADTPSRFTDIRKPDIVQAEIYRQAEANENRKYDRIGQNASNAVAAGGLSVAEQLEKLEGLRDRGSISAEEYEAQKGQILGS